ncbi:MAG TPA: 3-phosphoshikimate 1-carboxyvinyltransferase [Verrucomicrobiae bacterium]
MANRMPEVIEVHPLAKAVRASITVPGSKSITNRALVLAALGRGRMQIRHALWSEDTQVMVDCLRLLGFDVQVEADPSESGNRHISVIGGGGGIPEAGTAAEPLELHVGNAGTAARFLAAMVCLGRGVYRLSGVERMHQRPQSALLKSLRQLGYRVETPNDKLPAVIFGEGPKSGSCVVSIEESSQFASALLLSGSIANWEIRVEGENAEESPYVSMTSELIRNFRDTQGTFEVEPDASSASYIWGADWLLRGFGSEISVAGWMKKSLQIDARFPELVRRFPRQISRMNELGDSVMTAIVLAPFADEPKRFTDLGRLRVQECERVYALRTELQKCGARVEEEGDTLTVYPGPLHGATIQTYNDHRMAMCFGTLALKVPGIRIENPSCVTKTFPNFFQKLAGEPPNGLGAQISNARTGAVLGREDLHAE